MRHLVLISLVVIFLGSSLKAFGESVEEYIVVAEQKQGVGDSAGAVQIIQQALDEYPDNPTVLGYLGGYMGMQAGTSFESGNMSAAGELTANAFELLDRALDIEHDNVIALTYRGMMGVGVPEFFGRLEEGIEDLEKLKELRNMDPSSIPNPQYCEALGILATGYETQGNIQKAYETLHEITEIAPDTSFADEANQRMTNYITSSDRQAETKERIASDVPAISKLIEQLEEDPDNPELLYELAMAYGEEADKGYDERVYEDTTFRTNVAFDIVKLLDKAAKNDPDNMQYRLASGISSVSMPFFVNKLEQGMEHLNVVIESNAPDSLIAEARYWLGYAYYKKAKTEWINVVSLYSNTSAAAMTFNQMCPSVKRFDKSEHHEPCVTIEFILGFADELAPQTAVWIEDAQGHFVKTVYVSGFSGNAKEKQVNLPVWSESSEYIDTDGVTAASIDLGHHLYVWELKDSRGRNVSNGTYIVKAETSYWPSMEYQCVETSVAVGKTENNNRTEEGYFIPFFEVVYYP